jgi:hypothetical protein
MKQSRSGNLRGTRRALALALWTTLVVSFHPVSASEDLASPPPLLDPTAHPPATPSASEYWDLTMRLDSGYAVFARFLFTNAGPGDGNAVVTGHVVTPEGEVREFHNGRRKGRWQRSADGRRLDVGSSQLDLSGPEYRLEISKKKVKLDLRFAPTGRTHTPAEVTPANYRVDLLASAAPVGGTLWLKGMSEHVEVRGLTALVHTCVPNTESDLVLRRLEFFSLQKGTAMYLLELLTPTGNRTRWLNTSDRTSMTFSSTEVAVASSGDACTGSRRGECSKQSTYWVPGSLRVRSPGLETQLELRKVLLGRDPFQALPRAIRWLISLAMHPHRVWAETTFEVTLWSGPDHSRLPKQGYGITTVTFLNHVAQP